MKYVDYYKILGVARDASQDDIRKAYRRLAHQYHPDVAQAEDAEERFKDISVAYATLKDPEKRAAYDQLGQRRPGEDFVPPHQWREEYGPGMSGFSGDDFSEMDLADLLAAFASARQARQTRATGRASPGFPGEDYDVFLPVSLEQLYSGADTEVTLSLPEIDAAGHRRSRPRSFRVHIPRGAVDGQRLRLAGQGGPGYNGGPRGDLYLSLKLKPHNIYRVSGKDIYLDLPLAPWEAALGAQVEIPTPAGRVEMTVPPATASGRQFRLPGRGLPGVGKHPAGHLYAIASIVLPKKLTASEEDLFRKLAAASSFRPRETLYKNGDAK